VPHPHRLTTFAISEIGQDLVFQGHLHSPQPDPRMGFLSRLATTQRVDDTRSRLRCSLGLMFSQLSPTRSWDFTNARFVYVLLACKWWTRFTVARPILLPTHQPTAHGAHTESLGATHPVARTPSSWDATGNYFQCSLPLFPMETQWIWSFVFWVLPGFKLH